MVRGEQVRDLGSEPWWRSMRKSGMENGSERETGEEVWADNHRHRWEEIRETERGSGMDFLISKRRMIKQGWAHTALRIGHRNTTSLHYCC